MKRILQLFQQAKAFVGYITVGDGGLAKSYQSTKALIKGGVNFLELGVPFSDPTADGVVITAASERALTNQITLLDVLETAKEIRQETEIPMILFTYFNPLLNYFTQDIFTKIKAAGIDGILVVDLPIDEAKRYHQRCIAAGLAPIYVITKMTSDDRVRAILKQAKGFLYYACRLGTTGIKQDTPEDLTEQIQRIKKVTHLPVVVGFGISTAKQAMAVTQIADGFVVGSLFVDAIANDISPQNLTQLAQSLIGANHATHTQTRNY